MSVNEKMTELADAVRDLTGGTDPLTLDEMIQNIRTVGATDIINTAEGDFIHLFDCATRKIRGLTLYGKTTQNGTPTPEAPVALKSVGDDGSVAVTVCGKNLVDLQNTVKFVNNIASGIPVTETSNSLTISGATSKTCSARRYIWYFPAGTYTLSAKMESDKGVCNLPVYASAHLDSGYTYLTGLTASGAVTFTLAESCYLEIRPHLTTDTNTGGETWTTRYYDIQIEQGRTATGFVEANNPILTASTPSGMPGIPVASGGNYTDANGQQWICDGIDFARGKYVQRVGVKVYTGNESWRKTGITEVNSYAADNSIQPNAKQSTLPMSTHFVGTTNNSIVGVFLPNEYSAVFGVDKSTLPTLADWIAWLKSQSANGTPLTVLYRLKTPIETDLTAEELVQYSALHTNYPQTVIYNDADAWMSVKYVVDVATEADYQDALREMGVDV